MLAIAGDDAEAKQTVAAFLDAIGYDAHDVGPLAEGWRYQRDTAAYAALYHDPDLSFGPDSGRQVTSELLQQQLDAAQRYRDM
ncbi:MAG: hypothetical protein PGN07_12135 [Aeromicrobium erythreum]